MTFRRPALVACLLAALVAFSGQAGALGRPHARPIDPEARQTAAARPTSPVPGAFFGDDGLLYYYSPIVVPGQDGYLFIGQDFDTGCADGNTFLHGMHRLASLAHIISASGRKVVFTVVPNKSDVERDDVSDSQHGDCASVGMTDQASILSTFRDPHYIPLRPAMMAQRHQQLYWKTDTHWTTLGATVWAKKLAAALSPKLAKQQKYVASTRTRLGDLAQIQSSDAAPETEPALLPANGVTVTTDPGSDGYDPAQLVSLDHSWTSAPAHKTYPGNTLLLGDSFSYLGLDPERVLFHKGRFLWQGLNPVPTELAAIKTADTVVIEVVQRFVSATPIATRGFRNAVKAALE